MALNGGVPLSVTRIVIGYVSGPWDSAGVHVTTPVMGSILAPGGLETRLKVNVSVALSIFDAAAFGPRASYSEWLDLGRKADCTLSAILRR